LTSSSEPNDCSALLGGAGDRLVPRGRGLLDRRVHGVPHTRDRVANPWAARPSGRGRALGPTWRGWPQRIHFTYDPRFALDANGDPDVFLTPATPVSRSPRDATMRESSSPATCRSTRVPVSSQAADHRDRGATPRPDPQTGKREAPRPPSEGLCALLGSHPLGVFKPSRPVPKVGSVRQVVRDRRLSPAPP
jgi:hypothetical protein